MSHDDEEERPTCERCGEADGMGGEDGKCDYCDGMRCDGCGQRGDPLNDNMMCPGCEPVPEECSECGEEAVLNDAGLCSFCVERENEGYGCEICGDGAVDLVDGICDACAAEAEERGSDGSVQRRDEAPAWLRRVVLVDRKPKIEEAVQRAVGKGAKVDWKKRFGCGHYGCAYAVKERGRKEPRYVVKITRDPTEGPMQAAIARRQKNGDYGFADGFAIVRGVYRIGDDVQHMGKMWPVYAVVREEVKPVNGFGVSIADVYPPINGSQLHSINEALNTYKERAAEWYAERARKKPSQRVLEKLEEKMSSAIRRISDRAPPLGEIMGILQGEGTPLRDVHSANIGVRHHPGVADPDDPEAGLGYIVIFDPGHTPYAKDADEASIARVNPAKKKPLYDRETGELNVPEGWAVRLSGLSQKGWNGEEDSLAQFVPERSTHVYALHPSNWQGTFYSLTNKDLHKIANYKPSLVKIVPGTLVADMAIANQFFRNDEDARFGGAYAASVKPVEEADLSVYKQPELLIPRSAAEKNPGEFRYELPGEHLSARANPDEAERAFHAAFGVPHEALLEPVWPKERAKYKRKIVNPSGLASYLASAGDIPQEQFMVALLDQRGMLMGVVVVSKGTINEAAVHPREVFAAAIAARAVGIIGVHNHPSGDTTPSASDVELTKRLVDVGAIIGIPVLDHIVLGRGGEHSSLAALGMLPTATRRFQNNSGSLSSFDFADAFGQEHQPQERATGFHLDELRRGDVVRVGKSKWLVFNNKHGAWVTKHGSKGKKMYQIRQAVGGGYEVLEMTGGGDLVGAPVASGDAEVVSRDGAA